VSPAENSKPPSGGTITTDRCLTHIRDAAHSESAGGGKEGTCDICVCVCVCDIYVCVGVCDMCVCVGVCDTCVCVGVWDMRILWRSVHYTVVQIRHES